MPANPYPGARADRTTSPPWPWWPGVLLFGAVTLGPLLAAVWLAFTGAVPLSERESLSPLARWHVAAAVRHLFLIHPELTAVLVRTVGVALAATALALALGVPLGYALSRHRSTDHALGRWESFLATGRLLPGFFWALGLAIPLVSLGLYDRPIGLIIVYSAPATFLLALAVRTLLNELPAHWQESLFTLGYSPWLVWNVWTWDWMRPRLVKVVALVGLGIWNEAVVALLLTSYRPTLAALVVRLSHLVMIEAGAGGPPGLAAPLPLVAPAGVLSQLGAVTLLMAIPPLLVAVGLGRSLVRFWLGPVGGRANGEVR